MTDFERSLATALRDEAEEISMTIDQTRAAEELRSRLDDTDDRRRRRTWTIAIAAAAAVAIAVVGVRVLTAPPPADPPPVQPGPSAKPFTSTGFVVPLTLTPPAWTAEPTTVVDTLSDRRLTWGQSVCKPPAPCDWGADFKLRIIAPVKYYPPATGSAAVPVTTYQAYVDFLRTLPAAGVTITDQESIAVGGRAATVMTMTTSTALPGIWGCELQVEVQKNCWGPEPDLQLRFAALDAPGGLVLMWSRASAANPDAQQSVEQFDQMLTTVRWGLAFDPAFSSTAFEVPFSARVPNWVAEVMNEPVSQAARHVTWNRCPGGDECIGLSVSRFIALPIDDTSSATRPITSYKNYVAYLTTLGEREGVTVTEKTTTTVDGRPATMFGFTTTTDLPDMLGCEDRVVNPDNCWSLAVDVPTRVVAIDTGGRPVVVLTRTPEGNPDRVAWLGQFDGFLASLRFR